MKLRPSIPLDCAALLAADRRQNDGRPEPSAQALTVFGIAVIARRSG